MSAVFASDVEQNLGPASKGTNRQKVLCFGILGERVCAATMVSVTEHISTNLAPNFTWLLWRSQKDDLLAGDKRPLTVLIVWKELPPNGSGKVLTKEAKRLVSKVWKAVPRSPPGVKPKNAHTRVQQPRRQGPWRHGGVALCHFELRIQWSHGGHVTEWRWRSGVFETGTKMFKRRESGSCEGNSLFGWTR